MGCATLLGFDQATSLRHQGFGGTGLEAGLRSAGAEWVGAAAALLAGKRAMSRRPEMREGKITSEGLG